MKILVTGAAGFVGSLLMPELVKTFGPAAVSVFVPPEEKIPETWRGLDVRIFQGNILDRGKVFESCRGQSHVIHLAALISYWKRDRKELMRVNRDGVKNIVDACIESGVERLIHVSSVGAVGFHKKGRLADETTPFNWPRCFHYMVSKHEGQKIVEESTRSGRLPAVILNPASIMGPGDHNHRTPHNQLYRRILTGTLFGCFTGGLGVVDVRDLVEIIMKALEKGRSGEKYLIFGANLSYREVVLRISRAGRRKAYPFPIPSFFVTAAGVLLEGMSMLTNRKPLLTYAYGRLSGWHTYYSNEKSKREFAHTYRDITRTIEDSCAYYRETFGKT